MVGPVRNPEIRSRLGAARAASPPPSPAPEPPVPDPVRSRRRATFAVVLSLCAALVAVVAPAASAADKPGGLVFHVPFPPGVSAPLTQGWNSTYTHNGFAAYAYDFSVREGTPVVASAFGVVSYVHAGETACGGAELRDHANYVTIDHPD